MRMKAKQKIKITIDILMTFALMFLMGYQFFEDILHEWAGATMLVLFIAHHILNLNWHKNLFKGKYTPYRFFMLCVDMLVLVAMLMQIYSGIVMSRHVFAFLDIDGGMALARRLHILGAYWGFSLMSLHIGFHWSMFGGMLKKAIHLIKPNKVRSIVSVIIGFVLSAYGLYASSSRGIFDNMMLKNEFIFMDFSESKLLFYIDYIAIMIFFAAIGYYAAKLLKLWGKKKP